VVLSWITGYRIPFTHIPVQSYVPSLCKHDDFETKIIRQHVTNLLCKGVISKCEHRIGEFLSSVFLVPKPNGSHRFILNLKRLNKFIEAPHFKLEDLRSVLSLIRPDCYMGTIDLQDAYYHVPIHNEYKKYLRFEIDNELYEFNCLPFGLCTAPYVFTKILKPVVANLRKEGIFLVCYLDDIWCKEKSSTLCDQNMLRIKQRLQLLGFTVNEQKCSPGSSQAVKYLGFILDSKKFKIVLPKSKEKQVLTKLQNIDSISKISIRFFAELIGTLVSVKYAVPYSQMHSRMLERAKTHELRRNNGDFDAKMRVPTNCRLELDWWKSAIMDAECPIRVDSYECVIFTDASTTGWGAYTSGTSTHGWWSESEIKLHINELELLAILYGLRSLCSHCRNNQILIRCDNTTAISYVNRQGGTKFFNLNMRAKQIWDWCAERNNWLFVTYIPSAKNYLADQESRSLDTNSEWSLSHNAFQAIVKEFGNPEIDLFATRLNAKCKRFVSWIPDPNSESVDSFTLHWGKVYFYAFPPFCLVGRVIRKIILENANGIIVVPKWSTQPWFSEFMNMVGNNFIEFSPDETLLLSPFREPHPLWRTISLVAGKF